MKQITVGKIRPGRWEYINGGIEGIDNKGFIPDGNPYYYVALKVNGKTKIYNRYFETGEEAILWAKKRAKTFKYKFIIDKYWDIA